MFWPILVGFLAEPRSPQAPRQLQGWRPLDCLDPLISFFSVLHAETQEQNMVWRMFEDVRSPINQDVKFWFVPSSWTWNDGLVNVSWKFQGRACCHQGRLHTASIWQLEGVHHIACSLVIVRHGSKKSQWNCWNSHDFEKNKTNVSFLLQPSSPESHGTPSAKTNCVHPIKRIFMV